MRRIGEGKKGLSNLVAYVLLISITISLSVLVYGWLKSYVGGEDVEECPEGINLIIDSYECYTGANGNLTVKVKNRGLFDIDGFTLRVHDEDYAEFGFYVFTADGVSLSPGESNATVYKFADYNAVHAGDDIEDVKLVDVQPFLIDGGRINCDAYASQRVTCN